MSDYEPSDRYVIPQQLIEAWINQADTEKVTLDLTKRDLDHLFFAFSQMVRGTLIFRPLCLNCQMAVQKKLHF